MVMGRCCPNARGNMKREGAKGCKGPVQRWRGDLVQFAVVEKQLRSHSMSCLAVDDQGDHRGRWYGSLQSD